METLLLIVVVVLVVGGWLAIHRAMRRQIRADAEPKKKEPR